MLSWGFSEPRRTGTIWNGCFLVGLAPAQVMGDMMRHVTVGHDPIEIHGFVHWLWWICSVSCFGLSQWNKKRLVGWQSHLTKRFWATIIKPMICSRDSNFKTQPFGDIMWLNKIFEHWIPMIWARLNQPEVICARQSNSATPQATARPWFWSAMAEEPLGFLGQWDHIHQAFTRLPGYQATPNVSKHVELSMCHVQGEVSSSIHRSRGPIRFPIYLFMMFIPTVLVGYISHNLFAVRGGEGAPVYVRGFLPGTSGVCVWIHQIFEVLWRECCRTCTFWTCSMMSSPTVPMDTHPGTNMFGRSSMVWKPPGIIEPLEVPSGCSSPCRWRVDSSGTGRRVLLETAMYIRFMIKDPVLYIGINMMVIRIISMIHYCQSYWQFLLIDSIQPPAPIFMFCSSAYPAIPISLSRGQLALRACWTHGLRVHQLRQQQPGNRCWAGSTPLFWWIE